MRTSIKCSFGANAANIIIRKGGWYSTIRWTTWNRYSSIRKSKLATNNICLKLQNYLKSILLCYKKIIKIIFKNILHLLIPKSHHRQDRRYQLLDFLHKHFHFHLQFLLLEQQRLQKEKRVTLVKYHNNKISITQHFIKLPNTVETAACDPFATD